MKSGKKPRCPMCGGTGVLVRLHWNGNVFGGRKSDKVCPAENHGALGNHRLTESTRMHISEKFPCPCTGVYRKPKNRRR